MLNTLKSRIIAGAAGAAFLVGGITGAVLLAGNNTDTAQSSSLPASGTSEESIMPSDTVAVDAAVTSGIAQIQSVADQALQQIQSATSNAPATSTPLVTTPIPASTSTDSEFQTIQIGIMAESALDSTTFEFVRIYHDDKTIQFNHQRTVKNLDTTSDFSKTVRNAQFENGKDGITLIDETGAAHKCVGYGETQMVFEYSDLSTLSKVKIQYKLVGLVDPVTVEIAIPGI